MIPETWNVLVIGAGPAGTFAARQLALKGMKVLLVDKSKFPRDKVCGCCLNQHAVKILKNAGLEKILTGPSLNEFRLGNSGKILSLALPGGQSLSRKALDASLVQEAQNAGVSFLDETKALLGSVDKNSREVILTQSHEESKVRAEVVLICDGLAGTSLNPQTHKPQIKAQSRFGIGAILEDREGHYEAGCIYMAAGERGYAGLVRLEDGRLNVAAALDFSVKDYEAEVTRIFSEAGFPPVKIEESTPWIGAPALTRSRKKVAGERFLILGDAAGYSEPFTGEGISWALDAALAASQLLDQTRMWDMTYEKRWARWYQNKIGWRQTLSRTLTHGLRNPAFLKVMMAILAYFPVFAKPCVNFICERQEELCEV